MCGKEGCDEEVVSAGVTGAGDEAHALGHGGVHNFASDGSAGIEWLFSPDGFTLLRGVFMAAEAALVGVDLTFEAVFVV
jgi:hypothetical protein